MRRKTQQISERYILVKMDSIPKWTIYDRLSNEFLPLRCHYRTHGEVVVNKLDKEFKDKELSTTDIRWIVHYVNLFETIVHYAS